MEKRSPNQEVYFQTLRIHCVETEISKRYSEQQMRCPVHLSIGQEGSAVGVAAVITKDDYMVSTHRGHAHYLAKGGALRGLLCELYGKEAGCSKGQGGSMHLVDWSAGFVASTSIVGGTIPVGVGTAFASYLRNERKISVVCIGEAAVEEGVFHEAANFAALHKLPVLFACENNLFSCYTYLDKRQPNRKLTDLAKGHGLTALTIDGNDPFSIRDELSVLVDRMRSGFGPVFVELPTYRLIEHCGPNQDDNLHYRNPEEVEAWTKHEPVALTRAKLEKWGEWNLTLEEKWKAEIQSEIEEAFQFAKSAPYPEKSHLGAYVYAE